MASKIRWGVVGSGGIARRRTIPEGILPAHNAQLISVFDVHREANNEVARSFGAAEAVSMEDLLKSEIDAVYIASPAQNHRDQAIAALKSGKHVLCEKPLGIKVQEAEEMVDAGSKAGVLLGAAFMMRFQTQHREALNIIRQGRIGKPAYGRAQLSCWYPPIKGAWRQDPAVGGGGALIDMGGHCVDLLEMFFGKPVRVSCMIGNHVHDYKSEDGAVATLLFENGAIATVDTFFCIPDSSSKNVLELYGSTGSILAKNTIGQGEAGEMVAFLEGSESGYEAKQDRQAGQGLAIRPEPVNTYRAEIEEFSQAIIEGREPLNSGQLGLENQRTLAACYESARTGRAVDV